MQHGYLPVEPGWYRKAISIPAPPTKAAGCGFEFDGVYRGQSDVAQRLSLGRHASGYTSFYYDVSGFAKPGTNNLLVVCVNPTDFERLCGMTAAAFTGTRI